MPENRETEWLAKTFAGSPFLKLLFFLLPQSRFLSCPACGLRTKNGARDADFVIVHSMFHAPSKIHKLLASLLPAVLFCSCLACVFVCDENAERARAENDDRASVCCGGAVVFAAAANESGECPLISTRISLQEQQNSLASAPANRNLDYRRGRIRLLVAFSAPDLKAHWHSPPIALPLYLQFRSIRI